MNNVRMAGGGVAENLEVLEHDRTIQWNNMFDTDCFTNIAASGRHRGPDTAGTNDIIVSPPSKFNNIVLNEQVKGFNKKPLKHACSDIESDFIHTNKKTKKSSKDQENKIIELCAPVSYRKEVYTKTVSSWLQNNQNANWEPVEHLHLNDNTELKKTKRVVQTRLANKGGIMKFDKPNKDLKNKLEKQNGDEAAAPHHHNFNEDHDKLFSITCLSEDTFTTFKSYFTQDRVMLTLVLIYRYVVDDRCYSIIDTQVGSTSYCVSVDAVN